MTTKIRPKSEKRRSRPLTRDRIVEAALDLADDSGDFSMRALGARLRVDPMAIYRHFRDKDALQNAMVDAVLSGFEAPPLEAGPPAERLRQMCQGLRTAIGQHPGTGLRAATTLIHLSPHTLELMETALGLLTELGLDRDDAALAYLSLIRVISGVAGAADQLRAAGQREDELHESMRDAYRSVSGDAFPHVSEMAMSLSNRSFDEQFDFGFDSLLAGFMATKKTG